MFTFGIPSLGTNLLIIASPAVSLQGRAQNRKEHAYTICYSIKVLFCGGHWWSNTERIEIKACWEKPVENDGLRVKKIKI